MKKYLILILISGYSIITNAQLDYTDYVKTNIYGKYIGGTENSSLFYVNSNSPYGGLGKLIKVYENQEELQLTSEFNLKITVDNGILSPQETKVKNGIIYSIVSLYEKKNKSGLSLFLLKRNYDDFKLMGQPVLLGKEHGHSGFSEDQNVKMYIDDDGIFIISMVKSSKNITRYDLDLNELWTKDLSVYSSGDRNYITKTRFDEKDHMIFFELNFSDCEDCGFFDRRLKVKTVKNALVYFDELGNSKAIIPELKGNITYSNVKYFYSKPEDCITGLYTTHIIGKDEFTAATGIGFLFCKWDKLSGELISSKSKQLTYNDIVTDECKKFLTFLDPKVIVDYKKRYPKAKRSFNFLKLTNGDYLLFKSSIGNVVEGKLNDEKLTSQLAWSRYFICIDANGEIKWSKFIPGLKGQKLFNYALIEENKFAFLSLGMRRNYSENNKYKLVHNGKGTYNDLYTINVLDLNTGELITRESFDIKKSTEEYSDSYNYYNNVSRKYYIGIQKNSGQNLRKIKFTTLEF